MSPHNELSSISGRHALRFIGIYGLLSILLLPLPSPAHTGGSYDNASIALNECFVHVGELKAAPDTRAVGGCNIAVWGGTGSWARVFYIDYELLQEGVWSAHSTFLLGDRYFFRGHFSLPYTCEAGTAPNPDFPSEGKITDGATILIPFCVSSNTVSLRKTNGEPSCKIGNPCNPATGNKYETETDIFANTVNFTRSYNSQLDGTFGFGEKWTSVLQKHLSDIVSDYSLLARRPDGQALRFQKINGVWQSDADIEMRLVQDVDGYYTLSLRDGSVERYDSAGRLLSETDSAGLMTQVGFDAQARPLTRTGPHGHTLTFGRNAAGRISSVRDPAGNLVSYSYDASNSRLTRVDYPDNTAKLYHYNEPSFTSGANLPHSLTGISYATVNPDGSLSNITRYATYGYDTTGKALSTEHAVTTNGSPQEKFTLAYNTDTQTTVTDPVGMNEVLTFNTNLGVKNLVSKVDPSPCFSPSEMTGFSSYHSQPRV